VQEWLSDDHLARFIVAVIDGLDVSALEASYSGGGSAPYPPKMMLALLFFGYVMGILTSRKLVQATYDLIPMIYK
jgi:transposase